MSLREDMEQATKAIAEEVAAEDVEIKIFIKDRFNKMLEHCENTEISVKTAAAEIFEGMEDGLRSADKEIKDSFRRVASEIFKFSHESGKRHGSKK